MTTIVCMYCTLQNHTFDICTLLLFKDLYLLFSVVCVGMCACVCARVHVPAEVRGITSLELAFQIAMSLQMWGRVLQTEFGSSVRVECALNDGVISSHLALLLFKENISDSYRQVFCTISNLFIIVAYFSPG